MLCEFLTFVSTHGRHPALSLLVIIFAQIIKWLTIRRFLGKEKWMVRIGEKINERISGEVSKALREYTGLVA